MSRTSARSLTLPVAIAMTMFASGSAQAAWQVVDTNARLQTEVDLATAKRKDGIVTGWVQHTHTKKATTQSGAYFVYRTMKEQVRLDCAQQTSTVLTRGYFDDDGSEIASIKGTGETRTVMPDTPEQRVLSRLCNPSAEAGKPARARAGNIAAAAPVAPAAAADPRFMDGPAPKPRADIIRAKAEAPEPAPAPAAAALARPTEKADTKAAPKPAEKPAEKAAEMPATHGTDTKQATLPAAKQVTLPAAKQATLPAAKVEAHAAVPKMPIREVSNPNESRAAVVARVMKARAGAPYPAEPLARAKTILAAAGTHGTGAMHTHEAHWDYEGEYAPYRWGDMKADFASCKSGTRQSPIDIRNPVIGEVEPIRFQYEDVPLKVSNNGHTIQVDYAPGSFILFGGSRYELMQFHFHSPSEERVNGRAFDMVAHLVHRSAQGRLAVVAVLLTVGAEQPTLQKVWNAMPGTRNSTRERLDVAINAQQLLPADKTYYSYMGSLTTPPCTEGVQWLVMKTPVEISRDQIAHFTALYPMNARPLQALNDRLIKVGK